MRVYRSKYTIELTKIYLPILISVGASLFIFPNLLSKLLIINFFFLILLILYFFVAQDNKPAQPITKILSLFIKISLLQLVILIFCMAVDVILLQINLIQYYNQNLKHELIYWGLFPWSLITILTISLIKTQKKSNQIQTLMHCTEPIVGKNTKGFLGAGIDIFLNNGLVLTGIYFLLGISLSLLYYLNQLIIGEFPYGINILSLLLFVLCMLLTSSQIYYRVLMKLKFLSVLQIQMLHAFVVVSITLVITAATVAIVKITHLNILQSGELNFFELNHSVQWQLLNFAFWLGFCTYLVPMLADITANYSSRQTIVILMFWPIVISIVYLVAHPIKLNFDITLITMLIKIIGCMILILFLWHDKHYQKYLLLYYYRDKNTTKKKYPLKQTQKLLQLFTLLFTLYLLLGLKILIIFYVVLNSVNFATYSVSSIGIFKKFFRFRK